MKEAPNVSPFLRSLPLLQNGGTGGAQETFGFGDVGGGGDPVGAGDVGATEAQRLGAGEGVVGKKLNAVTVQETA